MGSYAALWRARIAILRPGNAIMAAAGAATGMVVARDGALALATWIGAPLAAFLVVGFGNVLNDLLDTDLDRKAHPQRPLPSGALRTREARFFAALLLGFGLYEAIIAGDLPTFAFAAANALALVAYERWFKRRGLVGNVVVAALVASTFAFGAVAAGSAPRDWGVLWLLIAMAFLSNVARELLKDVEDAAADAGRRRTFAMSAGAAATRWTAAVAVVAAVTLSALAPARTPEEWWRGWLVVLAIADVAFLVGAVWAWRSAARSQRLLKLAMAVALVAFLAGPLLAANG